MLRARLGTALMALAFAASSAAAQPVPDGPRFQIDCEAVDSGQDALISEDMATIWLPYRFNHTNSDFRLKFYIAEIAFAGDEVLTPIARGSFFDTDLDPEWTRFPDLQARADNDDVPTTFKRGDAEYEIQAVTPIPRKDVSGNNFKINTGVPFMLRIDRIPELGETERVLAWTANCHFVGSAKS